MTPKEIGPEIPSNQDMAAFAKEYYKSYMEAIEEKKPQTYPKFAQEAPYFIHTFLLPNGCICMIFNSSEELKSDGGTKDWDDVQEIIVKGVEHFAGFFPFEGHSLGDWNKRGKRDALRDIRLMDKSDLGKGGAELESIIENITKMVKANPWLGKTGTEMVSTLRGLEGRVKGGFPTVDAIAALQSLKAYVPGAETVTIEFPDKELLEEISDGVKNLANVENKLDMIETRMFEVEKAAQAPDLTSKLGEAQESIERLEKQFEKVSNILTMLNSKVESYFSKSAEKERQSDLEKNIEEHTAKALSHDSKISDLEKEAENLVEEMRKMAARMDKDIHDGRKRIARMEKHFVDFAKLVQE
jgi:predicted  nucleic acid-binding Zn-ribbon protein